MSFGRCVGFFETGMLPLCRAEVSALAMREPSNVEAEALVLLLKRRVHAEGLTGLLWGGGLLLCGVVVVGAIAWLATRKWGGAKGAAGGVTRGALSTHTHASYYGAPNR